MSRRPSPLRSLVVAGMALGLAVVGGMLVLGVIFAFLLSQHPVEI